MSPRGRIGGGLRPDDRSAGFPPASRPRPVEGGLVARSVRGDIGEHWWSRRFVEVLESFALGSRLTRGKNYARRGQVIALEVLPGAVTAKVQGSRRTPYQVKIGLAPFSELVWAKVEVSLAEQAIYSARLLAGEMPPDLEQVFSSAGAPLFPKQASELVMSCSCPDWEVPCKHISATFYLLAERFDDDPFQILHWRGRARAALLGRLRELRGETPFATLEAPTPVDEPNLSGRQVAGAAMALADLSPAPSASSPASVGVNFWMAGTVPPIPTHPVLPGDLVLRQLPVPPAVLGAVKLVTYLRPLYARLADSGV